MQSSQKIVNILKSSERTALIKIRKEDSYKMINFSNLGKLFPVIIAILISGAFQTVWAFETKSFSLGFGPEEDKLMYYNSKVVKEFEEIHPLGPSSFCIVKGKMVSIVDTFNNKLKQFDENGNLINSIDMIETVKAELSTAEIGLACIASRNNEKGEAEFAVSDSRNGKVYIISSGRLVKTIISPDEGRFGQVEEVSYDTDGALAVCDWAVNKIYIFDKNGKALRELPSQLNGMYFDSGILYYIEKSVDGKMSFMKFNVASNKSETLFVLDRPTFRIAKLLAVKAKGNFIVAFFDDSIQEKLVKKDAEKAPMGYFTASMVSADGKIMASENVPVTTASGSQFFFDRTKDTLYYQHYNAELAPAGSYTLKKVNFDK